MSKSQLQTLFGYHWHTTRQLIDCADRMNEAEFKDNPGYGHGSIHELLFHLLRSDYSWRLTLETGQSPVPLSVEDFPALESLKTGFAAEQAAWEKYLSGLSEAEIVEEIKLVNRRGENLQTTRWHVLEHVVLHGMQHHSELAHWLTIGGQSPGNIDFIFY